MVQTPDCFILSPLCIPVTDYSRRENRKGGGGYRKEIWITEQRDKRKKILRRQLQKSEDSFIKRQTSVEVTEIGMCRYSN
jgi:hypothetical protein